MKQDHGSTYRNSYGADSGVTTREFQEGTVIVDLAKSSKKDLVRWAQQFDCT